MDTQNEEQPPLQEQEQPPTIIVPQLPLHHVYKIYQLPRTRKTEEMMETMARQNKIPFITIHDPFIENDINKLSYCSKDFIEEWVRTTQILLFDQFQQSMRNWTELTKELKREVFSVKYERKKRRYLRSREQIDSRAKQIDCVNIQNLPDDIINIIWSYVDNEVRNKFYLGKYFYNEDMFTKMLQRLNSQTLKVIYKKTAFCYHGLCMQKIIPSERYNNPPVSRKTKQNFVREISCIIEDYMNMYSDVFVFTTHTKNGQLLSKKEEYNIEDVRYYGMVYPLDFYEKKTLQLWKHLAIAFSIFIPNDYYSYLQHKYQNIPSNISEYIPVATTTPPLPESPQKTTPPESPLSFVFL